MRERQVDERGELRFVWRGGERQQERDSQSLNYTNPIKKSVRMTFVCTLKLCEVNPCVDINGLW